MVILCWFWSFLKLVSSIPHLLQWQSCQAILNEDTKVCWSAKRARLLCNAEIWTMTKYHLINVMPIALSCCLSVVICCCVKHTSHNLMTCSSWTPASAPSSAASSVRSRDVKRWRGFWVRDLYWTLHFRSSLNLSRWCSLNFKIWC